jgi:imidazolonepropionase-like amidohydrolase
MPLPLAGALLLALPCAQDSAVPLAFVGARIEPVGSAPIASGVLVVRDGLIAHLGALDSTPVPAGAIVRDLTGRVIVPGFVDTHSHIGSVEGGDSEHSGRCC